MPLPPGYTLEQPQAAPAAPAAGGGLPPGYQIEAPQQQQQQQAPGIVSQLGTVFSNLGHDALSAGWGATADANHITSNLFGLLDQGADAIAKATGTHKGGAFKAIADWASENQRQEEAKAAQQAGGRNDFISQTQRAVMRGVLGIPQVGLATSALGPVGGMAALGALQESDKGFWPALQAAAAGGATGGALTVMGPGSRPLRLVGAGAMTYAQARLAGDDHTTALAKATSMGGMNAMSPGGVGVREAIGATGDAYNLPTKIPPLFPNTNAKEVAAFDYLRGQGVPIDAATASGSEYAKHAQKVADTSLLGSVISGKANTAKTEALGKLSENLVKGQTPEIPAETHYDEFRKAVDDPANARPVPVLDRDGNLQRGAVGQEITQKVQMPVKVGDLKETLRPIKDEMSWMTPKDLSDSPAYAAIQKILSGPDFITAAQAENGLSGFKKEARTGSNPRSAGLAKMIIPQLQEMIDSSVGAVGGPKALESLQKGREAAASEAGADWLKDEFKKAQAAGGFDRADGLWADWQRLPDESKQAMFQPDQVENLDKFFLGTKKLAQKVNPSGSGVFLHTASQLGSIFAGHPLLGGSEILGMGALSKLLHSDWGVKLLTQGLELRPGDGQLRPIANQLDTIINKPGKGAAPAAPTYEQWRHNNFTRNPQGLWEGQDGQFTDERLRELYDEQHPAAVPQPSFRDRVKDFLGSEEGSQGLTGRLQSAGDAALKRIKERGTFDGTKMNAAVPVDDLADMAIWGAAKIANGTAKFSSWSREMIADAGEQIKPHLESLYPNAQKIYARHVATTGDQLTKTKELLQMYRDGKGGEDWYKDTKAELEKHFGPDADMMVDFLAATSPNTTVASNVTLALKAYRQYRLGQPFEGYLPETVKSLNKAAAREDFGGLKVKSFRANLHGETEPVTVDRWMARAFGFDVGKVTDNQYKFIDYATTQIAKRQGVEPRQVQAAIWKAIKDAQGIEGNTSAAFESYLPGKLAADPLMRDLIAKAKAGEVAPARTLKGAVSPSIPSGAPGSP